MSRADYLAQDLHTHYDMFYPTDQATGEVMPRPPTDHKEIPIPEAVKQAFGLPNQATLFIIDGKAVIRARKK